MSKLKVFEAFAGVGSYTMALRNLGIDFELVGISEIDRYAILSHDAIHGDNREIKIPSKEEMLKEFEEKHIAYNFSNGKSEIPRGLKDITKLYKAHMRSKNYGDIQLIKPEDLPSMDLLTLSSPCKNISVAGLMEGLEEGSGTQSSLIWSSFKIVEYHKPKYIIFENVKNLVSNKFKPYFDMICDKFNNLNYNCYWSVLNGKDFNVPQNRERVMMLCIRKDIDKGVFNMPIGTPTTKCLKDILLDDVEDRYYIPKPMLEKFIPNENFKTLYGDINPQKPTELGFIQKGEDGVKHQSNTVYDGDCVSCTLCARDWKSPKMFMVEGKPVKLGGCFDEPNGTTHQTRNVWEKEGVVPTVDTMQDEYRQPLAFSNQMKIRKLTPVECWRLMGFKDEDFFKAQAIGLSNTKLYERAGRGIVVPMLESIFRNMMLNEE